MALKYQCSYQQVRNWVKRYEEMGSKGLEDRRGRRAGSLPSGSPEEELRDKIVELERKNFDLQMENDLLEKVRRTRKEGSLSLVHRLAAYKAIRELSSDKGYPVDKLCKYLNITRSAYYRWLKHPKSNNELQKRNVIH